MCSPYRGFIIVRFSFINFAVTGVKKIVCYTEDFLYIEVGDIEVHYIILLISCGAVDSWHYGNHALVV